MREFLDAAAANDFFITNPVFDGKIHRFGRGGSKDSAWYVIFQTPDINGNVYIYAEYGDWKTGERYSYRPNVMKSKNWHDQAKINAHIAKAAEEARAAKEKQYQEAAIRAETEWGQCHTCFDLTDYMIRKQISNSYGARFSSEKKTLVVPMRDYNGKIWGLQHIDSGGGKKFTSGCRAKGNFHVIGAFSAGSKAAYICEGFATGVSIHQATGYPVIVTFSASNLVQVASEIGHKLDLTVCADSDHVGIESGKKAAEYAKCNVIWPAFSDDDGEPTDFNDLHCREGLDEVRSQVMGDEENL